MWIQALRSRRPFGGATLPSKVYENIPLPHTITPASYIGRLYRPPLQTHIQDATVDAFKCSFYPRSVKIWNTKLAVNTPSVATFQEAAIPTITSLQPPTGFQLLYTEQPCTHLHFSPLFC